MQLHRALQGDEGAAAPPAWILSRVCEEFSLDPVRGLWVMENAPIGLIEDIIEMRAYASMWAAIRDSKGDTKTQTKLQQTATGQRVLEIELELAKARKRQRSEENVDDGCRDDRDPPEGD